MLPLSAAVKIYYCRTPINLHKSFDGLPGAVRQYLEADPASGHLFVFLPLHQNLWANSGSVVRRVGDISTLLRF